MVNNHEPSDIPETARRAQLVLASAAFFLATACSANTTQVEVEIHDETPFHVFAPGNTFSFDITVTDVAGPLPEQLGYQWRNFRGEALGPVVPLTAGDRITVNSPVAMPEVGNYGLAFLPDDPNVTFNASDGQ